jgi:Skp family chaperone for outer membrane proteins
MGLQRHSTPRAAAALLSAALCLAMPSLSPAQEAGPANAPGILAQVQAQTQASGPSVTTPIVVLNQEQLLSQSRYGQRIQREVEEAGAALSAENREIESQLVEEELALTEQRATMSTEEFRPLAEEFDIRVEGIRAAQEAKSRALQSQAEAAQARFFEQVFPILISLLRERGATVLMDNRAVLLSVEGADITEAAIALVDAELGEGPEGQLIDLDGTGGRPEPRPAAPAAGDDVP